MTKRKMRIKICEKCKAPFECDRLGRHRCFTCSPDIRS